jgi:hypothetical protein
MKTNKPIKIMKYLFIIALWMCLGCSLNKRNESKFEIKGSWNFESLKFIGTDKSFSFLTEEKGSLYAFFGADIFYNCVGKSIEFLDEGRLKTNLANQELLNTINFRYNLQLSDSLIVFSAKSSQDSSLNIMPVKLSTKANKMIWNIDNILEVVLTRMN